MNVYRDVTNSASPSKAVQLSTISFRRPTGATVALKDSHVLFLRWGRRTVVDITVDGDTRAHPLDDELHHFQGAISIVNSRLDTIAYLDRC